MVHCRGMNADPEVPAHVPAFVVKQHTLANLIDVYDGADVREAQLSRIVQFNRHARAQTLHADTDVAKIRTPGNARRAGPPPLVVLVQKITSTPRDQRVLTVCTRMKKRERNQVEKVSRRSSHTAWTLSLSLCELGENNNKK